MTEDAQHADSSTIDGAKFSQLILRSEQQMRAVVLAMVPGCRDVDDIIQESCSAIWSKIEQYDAQRDFGSWACAFVRLQTLAWLKRQKNDRLQLSDQSMDILYSRLVEEADDDCHRADALEDCLAILSSNDQNLLTQRYVEGLSVKELSEDTAIKKSQAALYKFFARLQTNLLQCIEGKLSR